MFCIGCVVFVFVFFFSSRRRHTRCSRDWSSDVCSSDLLTYLGALLWGHARLLWTRELTIVLLLTAWYIAGVPFALWRRGSFQTLTDVWLKTLLIFFLLTQALVTLERIRKLLWAIILSELAVASLSIVLSSSAIWLGERMFGFNLGILR